MSPIRERTMHIGFPGWLVLRFSIPMFAVLLAGCVSTDSSATNADAKPQASSTPLLVIDVDNVRVLGDSKATIAIVEYADYECPFCRQFHESMLPKLKSEYIDKGIVRYFYKDFPIRTHPQAFKASVATFCAAQQKRYWPMHDKLYTTTRQLTDYVYASLAGELGLDQKKFENCRKGQRAQDAINQDLSQALRLGITATPTFVIGRIKDNRVTAERMAVGTPSFDVFVQEIEALHR